MPERIRRDPICGREFLIDATTLSCAHGGETWFFCSRLCQVVFGAFPDQSVEIAHEEAARHRDVPTGEALPEKPGRRQGG
jgi:YHS domain-containing protein